MLMKTFVNQGLDFSRFVFDKALVLVEIIYDFHHHQLFIIRNILTN